jgi:farnesyl diphosphate synthase
MNRLNRLRTDHQGTVYGCSCGRQNTHNAKLIGLAFQIHDDIIGIESPAEVLGKSQNIDAKSDKPVYPLLLGIEKAKQQEQKFVSKALYHLQESHIQNKELMEMIGYLTQRKN